MSLIVVEPFGGHAKGDRITDATEIETVLGGDHQRHVVRVADEPAPAPAPPPPAAKPAVAAE